MMLRGLCRLATAVVVITSSILIESACAAPRGRMYVVVAPPPPVVEARVVTPGSGYLWVGGYHRWDGRAYVWMPGAWVRPPHARTVWVPAHWVRERRGWYFVEGHWR